MSSACDVKLYIYDVTRGLARQMSSFVLGKQINGIWHTGIVVYEKEFFFGSNGIGYCRPCGTVLGEPDEIHHLGATQLSEEEFQLFLIQVGEQQFRPECYHLFDHNCNTFSNEVSQFLTGQTIPKHVLEVPKEIFNTQLGAMIKPIYESMTAHPIGGNSSMTSAFTRSSDSHSIDQPRPAISNIDQPHSRNSEISENSKDSTSAVNVGLDNENMVDKKNDVEAIVKSLLEGDTGEIVKAVILVRDVSLSKVSNESAIEYSSAILECIQKNEHLPKETVYHSLMALRNFMKISPEVVNLTCLIGRDLSKFRELSPAMDKLCNELDEYINTTRD